MMKKVIEKISNYYLIFCVYGVIGWLYEVFWMWFVVPPKHFVNRGVLIGPLLPIYGIGMLVLLLLLQKMMKKKHKLNKPLNLIVATTTFTTFIYTTIVEYTTPKIYNVLDYLKGYGIGLLLVNLLAILIMFLLTKNKKIKNIDITIILVFLLIWIITTAIEYISHFITDKAFHMMLWNYSKDFLNINKRVNWDASRNFAIGGTFLLYTIQPLIEKVLKKIKVNKKITIACVIGIIMLIDFIFHVILKII